MYWPDVWMREVCSVIHTVLSVLLYLKYKLRQFYFLVFILPSTTSYCSMACPAHNKQNCYCEQDEKYHLLLLLRVMVYLVASLVAKKVKLHDNACSKMYRRCYCFGIISWRSQ